MSPAEEGADTRLALSHRLLELINGSWVTQAISVAAELRLADHLDAGPRGVDELAALTGTDTNALRRLLRALCTIGVCELRGADEFALTPLGQLLRTDTPGSLRHWALWWGRELWPVWGNLLYSVRTGKSARALLTGVEGFAHLDRDPAVAALFHRALAESTALTAQAVTRSCDFSGADRIADIGGGYGQLLLAILRDHPRATGILFDRPHAVEDARTRFEHAGLADRCDFVAGDFFEAVPAGADVYLLKTVIHDWSDADSARILGNCRRAMSPASRLLLIEQVLPDEPRDSAAHRSVHRSDLNMLVALAARERTEAEFRRLLAAAGLATIRVFPAGPSYSVIEARPA